MVARDHFPFCLPRHFLFGIRTGAIALPGVRGALSIFERVRSFQFIGLRI